MREIQPRYGNLRILLHNRFCEAAAHCPRALSIHYQPVDIVLSTSTGAGGQEESLVSAGGRAALAGPGLVGGGTGAQRSRPPPLREQLLGGLGEGRGHTGTWGPGRGDSREGREGA